MPPHQSVHIEIYPSNLISMHESLGRRDLWQVDACLRPSSPIVLLLIRTTKLSRMPIRTQSSLDVHRKPLEKPERQRSEDACGGFDLCALQCRRIIDQLHVLW